MLPHVLSACPETLTARVARIVAEAPPLSETRLAELADMLGLSAVPPAAAA